MIAGLASANSVLTGPIDSDSLTRLKPWSEMDYTPCLALKASNLGRIGVNVVSCTALFNNGVRFDPGHPANPANPANPAKNYRLAY